MIKLIFDPARVVRGYRQNEVDFSFSATETPLLLGGGTVRKTVKDATFDETTAATIDNNVRLVVQGSYAYPGYEFDNQTPAVCAVGADGSVTRLADGEAIVDIRTPVGTKRFRKALQRTGGAAMNTLVQYEAGSLARHVWDYVAGCITGKTASATTRNLFSTNNLNPVAPVVVRNPELFVPGSLFSGTTVMQGSTSWTHHLVSPRHLLGAAHVPHTNPVWFVGTDGVLYSATVLRSATVSGVGLSDTKLMYLSAPVPVAVAPYKVLPANFMQHLPSLSTALRVPVFSQARAAGLRMRITEWERNDTDGEAVSPLTEADFALSDAYPLFAPWKTTVIGGDSGSGNFLPVNGEMALLNAYYHAGGGSQYAGYITEINAAMNAIKDGGDATVYALQTVDLSGFAVYA